MNIYHFVDYREYLIATFRQRQLQNVVYSLRAFSRDLAITPSLTSRIMRRRDSITETTVRRIALALQLKASETEYFLEIHAMKRSGDPFRVNRLRELHRFEITRMNMDGSYLLGLVDFANFLKISLLKRIKATLDVALMLEREPEELWESCERLATAGYLSGDRERGWETNLTHVLSDDDTSAEKRDFHRLYLMTAIDNLFKHPDERYFYSAIRKFNAKDYGIICNKLREFITDIAVSPSPIEEHNMIYLLGTQLIPLDMPER